MEIKDDNIILPAPEEWKQAVGYPWYEISNYGRLRSIDRNIEFYREVSPGNIKLVKQKRAGKIIKPILDRYGYYYSTLSKQKDNGKISVKAEKIHRLVANAFLGDVTGLEVNHINGVKTCNYVWNLEIVTLLENMRHSFRTGLNNNVGENHSRAKLTNAQVEEIMRLKGKVKKQIIADMFNVSYCCIAQIHSGLRRNPKVAKYK